LAVFDVNVGALDGGIDIAVAGEIDGDCRAEFSHVLQRAVLSGAATVNLDMSMVTFLGSDGINTLVHIRRLASNAGVRFQVLEASRSVRRVLELMDLTDYLAS
jgi:anti-anti-sigma factor